MARLNFSDMRPSKSEPNTVGSISKAVMISAVKYLSFTIVFISLIACSENAQELTQRQNTEQSRTNPSFLSSSGKAADPSYVLKLPEDHLPHPDFDIEWWYLTANLEGDDGQDYALQWTLFRFAQHAQQNPWYQGQMFMAHASLHSKDQHWFAERFAPGGTGNSFVKRHTKKSSDAGAIELRMDDWQWKGLEENGALFPSTLVASITGESPGSGEDENTIRMEINLQASGPFVLQGKQGYSIKSADGSHASHYYSLPFIDASGTLTLPEKSVNVSGVAWYDHEWSSTLLDDTTEGWDWMSLHFVNGDKLMAFRMRLTGADGVSKNYQTGTFIKANGASRTLSPDDIQLSVIQTTAYKDKSFPLNWRVTIPSEGVDIEVQAQKANAYNKSTFPYYEGAVDFEGSHTGKGFLELTGY